MEETNPAENIRNVKALLARHIISYCSLTTVLSDSAVAKSKGLSGHLMILCRGP